jgi:hypothetical protein
LSGLDLDWIETGTEFIHFTNGGLEVVLTTSKAAQGRRSQSPYLMPTPLPSSPP